MTEAVRILHAGRTVGELAYDARDDHWSLAYAPEWIAASDAFPLSPAMPLPSVTATGREVAPPIPSGVIRRFLENLLPEGRALDVSASTFHVSKSNVFALIVGLGAEPAGGLQFELAQELARDVPARPVSSPLREVSLAELDERIATRDQVPFASWDGKVRMSIAGYQDKLLVYIDSSGRLFLADAPMASTHILKPEPLNPALRHLVANEHFCMSLARRMGLPVAPVRILRTPRPVLVVERFDRRVDVESDGTPVVHRRHIVDVCQAADMSRDAKYEHNQGSALPQFRDGVSFEVLFSLAEFTHAKAAARQTFMRWALIQFLIGNCDAHGKNFSFFVSRTSIDPSPWYDLVNVQIYPGIDHEIAMAFGDVFSFDEVTPFALADFATRCKIPRALLSREAASMARSLVEAADQQVADEAYEGDERPFVVELAEFVKAQAARIAAIAREAAKISGRYL